MHLTSSFPCCSRRLKSQKPSHQASRERSLCVALWGYPCLICSLLDTERQTEPLYSQGLAHEWSVLAEEWTALNYLSCAIIFKIIKKQAIIKEEKSRCNSRFHVRRKGYPLCELGIVDDRPCYFLPLPTSFKNRVFKETFLSERKLNHSSANYTGKSRRTLRGKLVWLTQQGNQLPVYLWYIYLYYIKESFPVIQWRREEGEGVGSCVFSKLNQPVILRERILGINKTLL